MVFRRRADHRRAADVDILDAIIIGTARRDCRLERVEIDHQQVDGRDAVLIHCRHMVGVAAQRQQPAMHHRVQRLHAPVHHLREPGQLRHVPHVQPRLADRPRRAAGGDEFDTA